MTWDVEKVYQDFVYEVTITFLFIKPAHDGCNYSAHKTKFVISVQLHRSTHLKGWDCLRHEIVIQQPCHGCFSDENLSWRKTEPAWPSPCHLDSEHRQRYVNAPDICKTAQTAECWDKYPNMADIEVSHNLITSHEKNLQYSVSGRLMAQPKGKGKFVTSNNSIHSHRWHFANLLVCKDMLVVIYCSHWRL